MLHKEIPFLRIGVPLCAGIISGLYFKPDTTILVIVVIAIVSGFAVSLFYNKSQFNLIFGYSLTISLFTTGLFLYTKEKDSISALTSEETIFACTLSDYPAEKENSYMLTVKLNRKITMDRAEQVKGSMIIYNRKDSSITSLVPGDLLLIKCKPVEIENKGNPYEFDYKFYMENQGIRYYAFTSRRDIIKHIVPGHRKLIHKALIIREKIISMYRERGITGERLALVAAITLGQKNMLDPEQKQNFIRAGVMHIMAVSGLHAIILSLFVFNLLYFLKRRFNIIRILITILILWSFAFVTGLTPSVLRATLMFTFLQAGTLMKREVNGINSILASAFVLILIRPSVIFDAGFLLSYSAVIYIISFYYDFYQKLQFNNWLTDKIWQSAVVTIIAQAGTLPLTIMLFNRFPTYFILTNVIIVPLSNLLIVTGCLVPLLFPVLFLSKILALFLNYLTGLTEMLTARAASLPWSNIENIGMTTIDCILLTGVIFLFCYWLLKKQSISIFYPLLFLLFFILTGTITEISSRTTNEIIVYNAPGSQVIGIKTGKILNIYSDTLAIRPEVLRHSATLGLKIRMNQLKDKFYCIRAGEKNILISNSVNKTILTDFRPDIIILTGLGPPIESNQLNYNSTEALIFTSGVFSGYISPDKKLLQGIDSVHLVRKAGAFIKRI
ncbi:MAG: ComEC family competence protein [Bacteroidetes bacterium]|nr:MAG: ComEC family competence protein [Bacteroidota bacterium]